MAGRRRLSGGVIVRESPVAAARRLHAGSMIQKSLAPRDRHALRLRRHPSTGIEAFQAHFPGHSRDINSCDGG